MIKPKKKYLFVVLVIILCLGLGYLFTDYLLRFIIKHFSEQGTHIITQNPLDIMNILITGTVMSALIISMPFLIVKLYYYVKDALYIKEREMAKKSINYCFLPIIGAFLGLVSTHFFIMPFFSGLMGKYGIENVLGLIMVLKLYLINALIMAVIFTLPIILKILSNMGLIKRQQLVQKRKIVYVLSVLAIAIVTPTTDAFTLMSMFIPMIIIYEGSIISIKKEKYINELSNNNIKEDINEGA